MRLWLLIAADTAVFVIAFALFVALLPSNIDTDDPSSAYAAAFWISAISLVLLLVLLLVAIGRRFANRNINPS